MTQSIQIYLEKVVPEKEFLDCLSKLLGIAVETINYPNDEANGFAMIMDYDNGLPLGITVNWSDHLKLDVNLLDIAKNIAARYETCVVVEPFEGQDLGHYQDHDPYLWNVIFPSGKLALYKQSTVDVYGLVLTDQLEQIELPA
ncbi:hypothetical protein [Leptolyngbya sp. PCC 6406]|uniref:hypothetical protein n=1 Tax=Leptolyngbya sp. PCC 6406 TaxID=1173264 RepID=UPI0002ABD9CD|nr:hypothetical protein [Leptolyngbya sp. PCC 6406]